MVELAKDPDFVRLQALQMAQGKELPEFRLSISSTMAKLVKQMKPLCEKNKGTQKENPYPRDTPNKFNDQSYLFVTDLDRPSYAACFLDNEDYIPSKCFNVTMPRFDGTKDEG